MASSMTSSRHCRAFAGCSSSHAIRAFTYKGRAVDVKQVGRDLGVRYVLEGSVRKAAHRLRVKGQLIDATSRSASLGRALRKRPSTTSSRSRTR